VRLIPVSTSKFFSLKKKYGPPVLKVVSEVTVAVVLTEANSAPGSPAVEVDSPIPRSSPNLDMSLAFDIGGFLSIYEGYAMMTIPEPPEPPFVAAGPFLEPPPPLPVETVPGVPSALDVLSPPAPPTA
jgi:hypothetical protein